MCTLLRARLEAVPREVSSSDAGMTSWLATHTSVPCKQPDDTDGERHVRMFLRDVPQLKGELLWGRSVEWQRRREADEGQEHRREGRSSEIALR